MALSQKGDSILKKKSFKGPTSNYNDGISVSAAMNPDDRNPFKFIESALTEAKAKIEKMKATPKILESLPDVSTFSRMVLNFS